MVAIRLESFQGMIPKESDRLLPQNAAAHAENCRTYSGELVGFNQPMFRYPFSNSVAPERANIAFHIHYKDAGAYKNTWIKCEDDFARVQPSPVINDKNNTYYATVTVGGESKLVSFRGKDAENATFSLASQSQVELPELGRAITAGAVTGAGSGTTFDRVYVVTLMDTSTGVESPPSEPFTQSLQEGQAVELTIDTSAIPAKFKNGAWDFVLYRSVTGTVSTNLFRVTKVFNTDGSVNTIDPKPEQITVTKIVDKWPTSSNTAAYADGFVANNTILGTTHWVSPKNRNLQCLQSMAGGFMAAFDGNKLYFSEAFRPYAWPDNYSVTVDDDVVALAAINQSLVVMTRSHTYLATGNKPSNVTLTKFPKIEPCVSPNAVSVTELGVVYVSREGLILVNTSGTQNLTQDSFTTHEWAHYIEKAPGYEYTCAMDDYLFILFTAPHRGFCIDVRDPRQWFSELTDFDSIHHLEIDRNSGLSVMANEKGVYTWDTPKYKPCRYKWRSKKFSLRSPVNFGALRLEMDKTTGSLSTIANRGYKRLTVGSSGLGSLWTRGVPKAGSDEREISGEITVRVWADDRDIGTFNVTKERMVRLPSGFKAITWQFEVDSYSRVYSIHVAETSKGLIQA